MWRSACWRARRLRICFCTVTSRAVVGSSANSSLGPHDSAIAMTTRWRMPPDNWCGYSLSRRRGSGMPTDRSSSSAVSLAKFVFMSKCSLSDSVIWRPILTTGLSEVMGSWKIMAMPVPYSLRDALDPSEEVSWPSKVTVPSRMTLRLGSRFMMERDSTDLPEPDSPTTPSVWPASSENVTPSTARTTPRSVRKCVFRSLTSSIAIRCHPA